MYSEMYPREIVTVIKSGSWSGYNFPSDFNLPLSLKPKNPATNTITLREQKIKEAYKVQIPKFEIPKWQFSS